MRPTWALPPEAAAPGRPDRHERPPLALGAAVAGVVALAALEVAAVAGRDDLRPAMRAVLVGLVLLQLPCAWAALRRWAPAAMVLLLCGVTAVVAGLAGAGPALAVLGAGVVVLVARSLRWFPSVQPWA